MKDLFNNRIVCLQNQRRQLDVIPALRLDSIPQLLRRQEYPLPDLEEVVGEQLIHQRNTEQGVPSAFLDHCLDQLLLYLNEVVSNLVMHLQPILYLALGREGFDRVASVYDLSHHANLVEDL
jgi:hypothetical protein